MGRLTVAETLPKRIIRVFRIFKGLLILGCCIFLFLFVRKEKWIMDEYHEISACLDKMKEYEWILKDAANSYAAGDLAQSEALYLELFSEGLTDIEPYIGLSDIYCDRKWYDKALEILEAYPEGNGNGIIETKIQEIKELIQILEQSLFEAIE